MCEKNNNDGLSYCGVVLHSRCGGGRPSPDVLHFTQPQPGPRHYTHNPSQTFYTSHTTPARRSTLHTQPQPDVLRFIQPQPGVLHVTTPQTHCHVSIRVGISPLRTPSFVFAHRRTHQHRTLACSVYRKKSLNEKACVNLSFPAWSARFVWYRRCSATCFRRPR